VTPSDRNLGCSERIACPHMELLIQMRFRGRETLISAEGRSATDDEGQDDNERANNNQPEPFKSGCVDSRERRTNALAVGNVARGLHEPTGLGWKDDHGSSDEDEQNPRREQLPCHCRMPVGPSPFAVGELGGM
jgi:hypothetical protein